MVNLWSLFCFLFNFFYLDDDLDTCARYYGDKHIHKMVCECGQIVSYAWRNVQPEVTSHIVYDCDPNHSHRKHPVVLWAQSSREAYHWVIDLAFALQREKIRRKDTQPEACKGWSREPHKSLEVLEYLRNHVPAEIPALGYRPQPPACVPDCYKLPGLSVMEQYRLYYAGHKVQVTHLSWLPFVEEPPFLNEYKKRVRESETMQRAIVLAQLDDLKEKKKPLEAVYDMHPTERHAFIKQAIDAKMKKRRKIN